MGTVGVAPNTPVNSSIDLYVSLLAQTFFKHKIRDITVRKLILFSFFISLSVRTCWMLLKQSKGNSGTFGLLPEDKRIT